MGIAIKLDGVVAQLVERLVRNEKVAGSIPVGSTIQKGPQLLAFFSLHKLFCDFLDSAFCGIVALFRLQKWSAITFRLVWWHL